MAIAAEVEADEAHEAGLLSWLIWCCSEADTTGVALHLDGSQLPSPDDGPGEGGPAGEVPGRRLDEHDVGGLERTGLAHERVLWNKGVTGRA